jgi:predicted nucleotidyltransferase
MDMEYTDRVLKFEKELSELDRLVIDFVRVLDKSGTSYVIVSGYIAILLGRSRTTEDVDLFIAPSSKEEFLGFCKNALRNGFRLLNADNPDDAYDLIEDGSSLRMIKGDALFPNFEIKLPRSSIANICMSERIKIIVNGHAINASPLELQIAYKLYLGGEKDFDDARHIYRVLDRMLDQDKFKYYLKEMHIRNSVIKDALGDDLEA